MVRTPLLLWAGLAAGSFNRQPPLPAAAASHLRLPAASACPHHHRLLCAAAVILLLRLAGVEGRQPLQWVLVEQRPVRHDQPQRHGEADQVDDHHQQEVAQQVASNETYSCKGYQHPADPLLCCFLALEVHLITDQAVEAQAAWCCSCSCHQVAGSVQVMCYEGAGTAKGWARPAIDLEAGNGVVVGC